MFEQNVLSCNCIFRFFSCKGVKIKPKNAKLFKKIFDFLICCP
jgi:hypothetical protein